MLHDPHPNRARYTIATKRRDQNTALLISVLRIKPQMRVDVQELLGVSASGANKYIHALRRAGIVEIERMVSPTRVSPGQPLFRLVRDAARVDEYLAAVERGGILRVPKATADRNAGRHVHRIQDESTYYQGMPALGGIPAPDPVLAAFFGLAPR